MKCVESAEQPASMLIGKDGFLLTVVEMVNKSRNRGNAVLTTIAVVFAHKYPRMTGSPHGKGRALRLTFETAASNLSLGAGSILSSKQILSYAS